MTTLREIFKFIYSAEFHDGIHIVIKPSSELSDEAADVYPFSDNYSNVLMRFAKIVALAIEVESVMPIIDYIEWSGDVDTLFDRYATAVPRWEEYTQQEKNRVKNAIESAIILREIVEPMMKQYANIGDNNG